jgi:hypothetical protein
MESKTRERGRRRQRGGYGVGGEKLKVEKNFGSEEGFFRV